MTLTLIYSHDIKFSVGTKNSYSVYDFYSLLGYVLKKKNSFFVAWRCFFNRIHVPGNSLKVNNP